VEQEGDQAALEAAVQEADAVISMMPPPLHPKAAALALKHGKHFLTTSYVSDAMRALEPLAKEKNVLMINECGVDPGTDHSPPPPPSSSSFSFPSSPPSSPPPLSIVIDHVLMMILILSVGDARVRSGPRSQG